MRGALGIDIGGTKIALGAVSQNGGIVARREIATRPEQGFSAGLARITEAGERVLSDAGWGAAEIFGIGIGCPGPIDAARGVIHNDFTLPGWAGHDIASPLGRHFRKPVRLENDANAALLGEALAGAARGKESAVMLTLGTGVGGAALVGGEILRGLDGAHPELGHIPVMPGGAQCYCGARGCYESVASGPAIARAGKALGLAGSAAVFAAADGGDAKARAIVERVLAATESAVWSVIHSFLPEVLLFGGGIVDGHWPLFEAAARNGLERAKLARGAEITLARAALAKNAGLVGAASLFLAGGR